MYAAIDALTDKLERLVRKHKEKSTRSTTPREAPRSELARTCNDAAPAIHLAACRSSSSAGCRAPARAWRCTCSRTSGYYCIDNIPAALLKPFISYTVRSAETSSTSAPPSAWTRATATRISACVPTLIDELKRSAIDCEVLFLVADDEELLRRFAETRRTHPLGRAATWTLREAIAIERELLEPIADSPIRSSTPRAWACTQLRDLIHRRVDPRSPDRLSMQLRVLRLQARHPRRCGLRVRCALAPQSLLGERAAPPHRARSGGGALSRGAAAACTTFVDGHRRTSCGPHSGIPGQHAAT